MNPRISRFLSILFFITLWYIASDQDWLGNALLASPSEVLETIQNTLSPNTDKNQKFYLHAMETIKLATTAWVISLIAGILIGSLSKASSIISEPTELLMEFLRSIPPILAFPLFLVAFDFSQAAYTATILFGCLPIVILTTQRGISQINQEAFYILKISNASNIIKHIAYFMEMLPAIFLSARLSFSFALIITVVCEMVFTPRHGWALGALARDAQMNFDAPLFYTSTLTIGIFGYIINILLKRLEQWMK